MTDTMFTHAALTEAAKGAGVTPDQARTILEAAGVKVQPEKPALPTEPGSVIIATEVRGVKGEWRMMLDFGGDWFSPAKVHGHHWHRPHHITAWTEAVVLPAAELEAVRAAQDTLEELAKMGVAESDRGSVLEMAARLAVHGIDSDEVDRMVRQHYSTTTAPVTLTEDQVGEVWNANKVPHLNRWTATLGSLRGSITATVNAALAQYAAPAEGEPIADAAKLIASAAKPIDPADVREGDRVRLEMDNGDEATFTVRAVSVTYLCSRENAYNLSSIRTIHLLHREEA